MRSLLAMTLSLFVIGLALPAQADEQALHSAFDRQHSMLKRLNADWKAVDKRLQALKKGPNVVDGVLKRVRRTAQVYLGLTLQKTARTDLQKKLRKVGGELRLLHFRYASRTNPNRPELQKQALRTARDKLAVASELLFQYGYGAHRRTLTGFFDREGCQIDVPKAQPEGAMGNWADAFKAAHDDLKKTEKQALNDCFSFMPNPRHVGSGYFFVHNSVRLGDRS